MWFLHGGRGVVSHGAFPWESHLNAILVMLFKNLLKSIIMNNRIIVLILIVHVMSRGI